ncbi:MAG: hypothetical protein QXJ63_02495, partial [Candidatus Bathyarchaeia archaeon]
MATTLFIVFNGEYSKIYAFWYLVLFGALWWVLRGNGKISGVIKINTMIILRTCENATVNGEFG